jgi:hypothetical protein
LHRHSLPVHQARQDDVCGMVTHDRAGCRYALILCFRLFQVRQSKDCLRSEMSIYFPRATLPASYAERSV